MLAISKTSGTTAPRFHGYSYSSNAWQHENGASNSADPSAPSGASNIGGWSGNYRGSIAILALWNVVLSDAQIECLPFSLAMWYQIPPQTLWLLDQQAVGQTVLDLTGNGANQSAITGTTGCDGKRPGLLLRTTDCACCKATSSGGRRCRGPTRSLVTSSRLMALLPNYTGSFNAEPPYSDFWTYTGGTTCTPPITVVHSLSQLIPRDSAVRRHGTYSGRVTLRPGDHINNICSVDGVQLYAFPGDIINGSETWIGWSWRFPTGGITSGSFNGIMEAGVGNGFYHPQYGCHGVQAQPPGPNMNIVWTMQVGHKPGPGASDFNPTPPNGYKADEYLLGPNGPRPLTLNVWHDFYAHFIFSAYHGLTAGQIDAPGAHTILTGVMEIWHREEGQVWEKLYSNLNNGTALINRAPHSDVQLE